MQALDNNGAPLTNGVLYSFTAGTSSQQQNFTDSTCTTPNVNPLTFTTGARANVWLTTSAFYKFVLCAQNDGATCAAGDVLFSVDNVPGGSTSGGGGGGSPFISGSANPATSGILRLASGDTVCWRNAANSANLCFSKDTNDLLSWAGGSFKLPEVGAPTGVSGFDILWADSTAHRLKQAGNGGGASQLVNAGVDINTSDQVTQLHFGSTPAPLNGTVPNVGQCLQWNGSALAGGCIVYSAPSASTNASIGSTTMATAGGSGDKYLFNAYILQTVAGTGCSTNTTIGLTVSYTDAQTSSVVNFGLLGANDPGGVGVGSLTPGLGVNNGVAAGQSITWFPIVINAKASTTVSYSTSYTGGTCTTAPSYYVLPALQLIG
jgi:hypothetical protein